MEIENSGVDIMRHRDHYGPVENGLMGNYVVVKWLEN